MDPVIAELSDVYLETETLGGCIAAGALAELAFCMSRSRLNPGKLAADAVMQELMIVPRRTIQNCVQIIRAAMKGESRHDAELIPCLRHLLSTEWAQILLYVPFDDIMTMVQAEPDWTDGHEDQDGIGHICWYLGRILLREIAA